MISFKFSFPQNSFQLFLFSLPSLNSWEFSPWMYYLGDFLEGITVPTLELPYTQYTWNAIKSLDESRK